MSVVALKPFQKAARAAHAWEREELDHYVEPTWIWERLFARASFRPGMSMLDPACGFGRSVDAACRAGMRGHGSDVVPRWESVTARPQGSFRVCDFLGGPWPPFVSPEWQRPDVVAMNPPFKQARAFVGRALEISAGLVCAILPSGYVQGRANAAWLAGTPLLRVLFLCPRPSMPPGHVILSGGKATSGKNEFAVFVWLKGYDGEPGLGHLLRDAPVPAPAIQAAE